MAIIFEGGGKGREGGREGHRGEPSLTHTRHRSVIRSMAPPTVAELNCEASEAELPPATPQCRRLGGILEQKGGGGRGRAPATQWKHAAVMGLSPVLPPAEQMGRDAGWQPAGGHAVGGRATSAEALISRQAEPRGSVCEGSR